MSAISPQRRITAWLLDWRRAVIVFVCVATFALVAPLHDPSVLHRTFDDQEDQGEDGERMKAFARAFGQGDLLMVVIRADDVFTAELLAYIKSRTEALAEMVVVQRTESLANAFVVDTIDGVIQARPLFPQIPTDAATLEQKRKTALANPLWRNNLVSSDSTVAVISLFLPPLMRDSRESSLAVHEARELLLVGKPNGVEVYVTGLPSMFVDSKACAARDFKRFFWLTWLLIATFLLLAFRTLRGLILPFSVTLLCVMWTLGLMVVTGHTLTAVGSMLPTLIAVVCFSDAVHIMAHYYEQAQAQTNARSVIMSTMEHMITACFLTSVTTAAGFGSLVLSTQDSIRQFGVWAAIGIMLGYILNIALMPVVLSWLPLPEPSVQKRYEHSLCGYMLAGVVKVNNVAGKWVMATTVLLVVLSLIALPRLRAETSIECFLPASAPAMKGLTIARDKLTGFGSVELVLRGPAGCFREPWALRELQKVESFLEGQQDVRSVLSVDDLLQWTHGIVEQSEEDVLSDPHARGLIAEYMFLFSNSGGSAALTSLVTEDCSSARVCARLRAAGTGEQIALIGDLEEAIPRLDKRLTYEITGQATRLSQQVGSVMRSLVDSLIYTFLTITFLMWWQLRSLRQALLAMIPTALPVLLTVGLMGAAGISLNFATVLITSISLGIAVDDTIHFLARYRRELRIPLDRAKAIENTILQSGRAMTFTTIAMAAGCGISVLSDFAPIRTFGVLMAFTMFTALLADLLVLPYLLKIRKLSSFGE